MYMELKEDSSKERLLNISELTLLRHYFEDDIKNFKLNLLERGYPEDFIRWTLLEVTFEDRNLALQQKQNKENKRKYCLFNKISSKITLSKPCQ